MGFVHDIEIESDGFAVRMMTNQFHSLKMRLDRGVLQSQLQGSQYRKTIQRSKSCNTEEVKKWLINGWNTEHLLSVNQIQLKGDALRHSLHWAFPQAYYSVFAITNAYFQCVGFTESTHASLIKKFGMEVQKGGKYPDAISFCAIGARRNKAFINLNPIAGNSSICFDENDKGSIDKHIKQFLNATRDIDLEFRRSSQQHIGKNGKRKVRLNQGDWDNISERIGPTSLLSLLYRKRIKANYREIDTFLHETLDPVILYSDLIHCVSMLNIIHETFITWAIGQKAINEIRISKELASLTFVADRHTLIAAL